MKRKEIPKLRECKKEDEEMGTNHVVEQEQVSLPSRLSLLNGNHGLFEHRSSSINHEIHRLSERETP